MTRRACSPRTPGAYFHVWYNLFFNNLRTAFGMGWYARRWATSVSRTSRADARARPRGAGPARHSALGLHRRPGAAAVGAGHAGLVLRHRVPHRGRGVDRLLDAASPPAPRGRRTAPRALPGSRRRARPRATPLGRHPDLRARPARRLDRARAAARRERLERGFRAVPRGSPRRLRRRSLPRGRPARRGLHHRPGRPPAARGTTRSCSSPARRNGRAGATRDPASRRSPRSPSPGPPS